MTRPELRPLTAVRAPFAWAVVLYHLRLSLVGWAPAGAIRALGHGYLAVDIFFLLSGFVIWLNYGDRLVGREAATDFLVRRLARIWPLHAAMLAFGALLAAVLLVSGRPAPDFPFAALPLHLLLVQDWGWSNPQMWNDPAWSISAEWAAYLLAPVIALALPRRRLPTPLLLLVATLPLLALAALFGRHPLGFDLAHDGVPRCLGEFFCGAALSVLWRRWRGDVRIEAGCWIAGAACLASASAGVPEAIAMPFGFAALLLGLALGAERPRHPLGGRAIHWLGEISYATYLVHYLLFFAFKLAFVRDASDVPPAQALAYLLLVLAASALLHHGLERPAQRAILRAWKRVDPRAARHAHASA